jgi:CheY-like chemotaxis protein
MNYPDRVNQTQQEPLTILIADDEEPVRSVLITFLSRLGYRTQAVSNGFEALREIGNGGIDLVISDYSMPLVNGLQLYDRMVEKTPELAEKFILITGTAFTLEVSRFVEHHRTPFLEKPFRLPELASMVEAAIGSPQKEHAGV